MMLREHQRPRVMLGRTHTAGEHAAMLRGSMVCVRIGAGWRPW